MAFSRNVPAGLISKGFQRIAMNSTSTFVNSTCGVGTAFLISVEAQNARVVFNGTSLVNSTTGVLLTTGNSPYFFDGIDQAATKMRFARAAAGAILNIQSFGRPGDKVSA